MDCPPLDRAVASLLWLEEVEARDEARVEAELVVVEVRFDRVVESVP
jgi:hypothetical protein